MWKRARLRVIEFLKSKIMLDYRQQEQVSKFKYIGYALDKKRIGQC